MDFFALQKNRVNKCMVQPNSFVESPFDLRLPQLALVKDNSFRSRKLSTKISLSNKV
jgi:hypothetical protein